MLVKQILKEGLEDSKIKKKNKGMLVLSDIGEGLQKMKGSKWTYMMLHLKGCIVWTYHEMRVQSSKAE